MEESIEIISKLKYETETAELDEVINKLEKIQHLVTELSQVGVNVSININIS